MTIAAARDQRKHRRPSSGQASEPAGDRHAPRTDRRSGRSRSAGRLPSTGREVLTRRLSRPRQRSARNSAASVGGSPRCTLFKRSSPTRRQPADREPLAEIDVLARFERVVEAANRLEHAAANREISGPQPRDVGPSDGPAAKQRRRAAAPMCRARAAVYSAPAAAILSGRQRLDCGRDPVRRDFVVGIYERENARPRRRRRRGCGAPRRATPATRTPARPPHAPLPACRPSTRCRRR